MKRLIETTEADLLPKDGSEPMEGDLDMGNYTIENCGKIIMSDNDHSSIDMDNKYIFNLPNPIVMILQLIKVMLMVKSPNYLNQI